MRRIPTKKPRGPGKWVHSDAHGLTEKIWRDSVLKIDNKQESINTPSLISNNTPSTLDSNATSSTLSTTTSAIARTSPNNEQGQTSETPSPLTMLDFNDLETVEENLSRKINMVIVNSDDKDMDVGAEENDYELLDKEVMSVLLGLTGNMALD
jgi:hypothetical protein